ncbi:MAG: hypothetical protein HKP61_19350 [Dactylosporangium sp.]|nr:hypothetical protein [Dactylosporangium sp.]NNJ63046.1 hypothetical protein [Dactylosporangium sp.]
MNGDGRAGRLLAKASLPLVIGACWLLATRIGIDGIERQPTYLYTTSLLLAVGLYGSTYGIDLNELRGDRRRVLLAVTVGVLLKAVLIGIVLLIAMGQPLALVLGVAVAQIDPLAVASIMGDDRLSPRVKAILASWASFDDPVTVILTVYAAAFASGFLGLSAPTQQGFTASDELLSYGATVGANLVFALLAILGWRVLARWRALRAGLMLGLAVVAVWQFLALGVAIAGLAVRPAGLGKILPRVTRWALLIAAGLLGLLLARGVDLGLGVVLGIAAFGAQIVAGVLLSQGLPRPDRVHLALAQQNGITAIILALRMETQHPGVAAVVGPAVVVTNLIHYVANRFAEGRRTSRHMAG